MVSKIRQIFTVYGRIPMRAPKVAWRCGGLVREHAFKKVVLIGRLKGRWGRIRGSFKEEVEVI